MERAGRYRTMTALIATAAVLAWTGAHSLSSALGIYAVDPYLYLSTQLISAAVLVWAAWMSVSAGDAHVGTVPMMLGLSVITGVYGTLIGNHDSALVLRMSFMLPLMVPAAMMWADGQKLSATGALLLASAIAAVFVSQALYGALLVLSGAAMAASAFRDDAPAAVGKAKASRTILLELIAVHAGMMLLSQGLMLGNYIGATASAAIAIVSVYMYGHGMVMLGCSGVLYAFTGLMAGIPFAEQSNELTVIPLATLACIAVGILAFIGKEKAVGAGMAAYGAGMAAWVFDAGQAAVAAGSCMLLALCLAEAVRTWKSPVQEHNGLEGLGRIACVSSAGMLILSMALLSNVAVEFSGGTGESVNHMIIVGCAFMAGFSIMAMRGRMLTEAVVFLMTACCLFVYPLADALQDPQDLMPTGATLCVCLAIASYIFWRMDAPMRALGCALVVISLLVAGTGMDLSLRLAPMALAGIVFLLISLKKAYRFGVAADAKIENRANLDQSDDQYATVLMSLSTIVLMILALIGEVSSLLPEKSLSLGIFRLMLICSVLGFGLYSMKMGFTALGTYLIGTFLVCFLMGFLHVVGLHLPMELNFISAVLFVLTTAAFYRSGNRMMTVISALMLISVVAEPLMPSTWEFDLIVLAVKTASGLVALTMWIEYDVGRIIVPKYSKLWRKDPMSKSPARPVRSCILFSCLMLTSVMAMWAAAGPFMSRPEMLEFDIAVAASAVLCIVMSASLFHVGSPDWGALFVLLSIGTLSLAASDLANDSWNDAWTIVCIPLAVLAAARLMNGSRAVPALSIMAIAAFVLMDALPAAGSAVLAAIGIALAVAGSRGMITGSSWTDPTGLGSGWSVAMAATVGLCIFIRGTDGMLVASLAASVLAMMTGFGCGSRGRYAECLALLSASIPGFVASTATLAGADLSLVPLGIPAALMVASAMMFLGNGRALGAALCVIGAALALASIATGSWIPATVGCGMACLAVILSGIASEHADSPRNGAAAE